MRLVVLGAGAIGGVIAGFLARAGRDVLLVARGAQLEAVRASGLRVERPGEVFTVSPPLAAAGERFAWRDHDVIGLAVKTQDAAAALLQLAAPPRIPVLCLTNGVEAERLALRHADVVYGACVRMPATYLQPGVVQAWAAPSPGMIELGRYPDGNGDHADELAGELMAAGFTAEVRPSIMKWKRAKLLSNLGNAIDALCAHADYDAALEARARAEARACFAAAGLACVSDADDLASYADFGPHPIAGATRGGSSTWQSLTRGAALETDYLNGEIAMLGRLHGVPTPVNTALQYLAAEAARRGQAAGSMSQAELAARIAAFEGAA